jgi:hypothetical protein
MAGIGQRLGNFKYAARPPKTFPPFPEAERQRGDYRRISPFEVLESRLLGHELSIGSDECAFGELAVENGNAARSATAPMPADHSARTAPVAIERSIMLPEFRPDNVHGQHNTSGARIRRVNCPRSNV